MTAAKKAAPKPPEDEPDAALIVPEPSVVTVDGVECTVRRLKTRELLALLRVLTSGLGGVLAQVKIDTTSQETIARDVAALMLLSAPAAPDELLVFMSMVVEAKLPKDRLAVTTYLQENPDIGELVDVFEVIAKAEADDLAAIVGKLQAMWSRIATVYRTS